MTGYGMAGGLLLLLCGGVGAHLMNERDEIRMTRTEAYLGLLRHAREQIDCYGLAAPRIFERCDASLLAACGVPDGAILRSFFDFVTVCGKEDRVSYGIIQRFAEDFGRQYREEQVTQCDRYIELLEERRRMLLRELPNQRRLHITLCLAGAAMAVILLL